MGSNSFHLIVARANSDGQLEFIDQMKEQVRLLEGSPDGRSISDEAIQRAEDALGRLKKVAETRGATIRVVATSAVREASNRAQLMDHLRASVGLDVEVISGQEEARLIYAGILQSVPVFNQRVLCIDIGGGSTEICIGRSGRPFYAMSMPIGHLRLKEHCFLEEETTAHAVVECQRLIRGRIADAGLVREVRRWGGGDVVVGSSGTIERCAAMIAAARGDGENGVTSTEIHLEDLRELVLSLVAAKTKSKRMKLPGIAEKREDVMTGGAILLLELFEALGISTMRVAPTALREGALIDTLNRLMPSFHPFTDVRSESVAHLAERFDIEGRYSSARHSAKLVRMMLRGLQKYADESSPVHTMTPGDEDLLMAGVQLHQVGLFVGHSSNHKHAYYIVKNSELLLGFNPLEVEVIALLARYHRKKPPSSKDAEIRALPPTLVPKVMAMIALVRLGVALERRNTAGAVGAVFTSPREDGALQLKLVPGEQSGGPADVSLEAWAAEQELKFASKSLGQQVMLDAPGIGELWGKGKPQKPQAAAK